MNGTVADRAWLVPRISEPAGVQNACAPNQLRKSSRTASHIRSALRASLG
jgi:hypothetical protein